MVPIRACVLPLLCAGQLLAAAIPLTFEQRTPSLFVSGGVRLEPGRVTVGGITLRFRNAAATRMQGVGAPSPATYIGPGRPRTFQQFPKLAMHPDRGIDALFYGSDGRLEYDLMIAPGASPGGIRLSFDRARSVRLSDDGSLTVAGSEGDLHQLPPRVFQGSRPVAAHYALLGGNRVAIRLGKYDPALPLTIDPVLVYTKYFGGSGGDTTNAMAIDAQGNVYIAGQSNSRDFVGLSSPAAGPLPPLIAISNAGQTVTPLPVAAENHITAIGGTPDGKVLYAGGSTAVYYSNDGGATWTATGPFPVPLTSLLQSPPVIIEDIAVDNIDPSRAYVATNRGMYSTADNGQHWFPRDYDLAANYDSSVFAQSVTVSQVDHTLLYATTAQPNYLYKSTDAAGTWKFLHPAFPGEPTPNFTGNQIIFTLAPGGTDLYVVDGNGYLLKSTDAGGTWQKLAGGFSGAKAVRLDSATPPNIYVLDSAGLHKSTDGGLNFAAANPSGAAVQAATAFTYDSASGTLYLAVTGTLYASNDGGGTWKAAALSQLTYHTLQTIGGRVFAGLDTPSAAFLLKVDPTGSRVLYTTFFTSKPFDYVAALKVDSQGSAYLTGSTCSQNFAGANKLSALGPIGSLNSYVAKVSADGSSLLWMSVFGGSKGAYTQGLALDSAGSAYISGSTGSTDFPTTAGAFQTQPPSTPCTRPPDNFADPANLSNWVFVTKLAPDGASLVYATLVTGSCGSTGASAIAVNSAGEVYVGGYTTSPDMPVSTNAFQPAFPGAVDKTAYPNAFSAGFVAHLNATGSRVLGGTYLGGGYTSTVNAIAIDAAGNPVVTGGTWGIAAGATAGAYQTSTKYQCSEPISIGPGRPPSQGVDAFVAKFDPLFTKAAFLTYLGGGCYDSGSAVALDPNGNVWVAGGTVSGDFPQVTPYQTGSGNGTFVSELSADGSKLLFSSFSSGSTLAVDNQGAAYVAGATYSQVIPKQAPPGSTVALDKIAAGSAPAVEIDALTATTPSAPLQPYIPASIAPGSLVRLTGRNLGPATEVRAQLDSSNRLPFTLAGVQVMFDNYLAPILSVKDSSIDCFVPFEVSNVTQVQAQNNGQLSNVVRASVSPTAPQVLAIVNQDGNLNSAADPAPQGSVITVYSTGLGQTDPASVDGQVNRAPAAQLATPVSYAYIGQFQVAPQFAAAAVGMVSGISQVNLRVPLGFAAGPVTLNGSAGYAVLYVK